MLKNFNIIELLQKYVNVIYLPIFLFTPKTAPNIPKNRHKSSFIKAPVKEASPKIRLKIKPIRKTLPPHRQPCLIPLRRLDLPKAYPPQRLAMHREIAPKTGAASFGSCKAYITKASKKRLTGKMIREMIRDFRYGK